MLISDYIAQMLEQMLDESDGQLDIRRNDMATRFGCAPSQINYVITSRFTPENGYVVESRRGGGGYIRIVRKHMHRDEYLMHFFHAVGEALTENEARAMIRNLVDTRAIDPETATVMASAVSGPALSGVTDKDRRDAVRADVLRQMVLALMV
ncbi:MAG: CtsR family transcriptional regulator [Clostridia bacterium]|nr:CtsR family transcriptional regulator [Clostridia bacterium]